LADTDHRIELNPPDITPYRSGNTGIDYVTTFDSGVSGPHVVINALTHGNELCGAVALDYLFRLNVRPQRGKLTFSFANVAAYQYFDPERPTASRYVDEDFNRLWAEDVLDGPRDSVELRRARRMRPLFDQADFLLDLHSMQHPTAPLMLCGLTDRGKALARAIGYPQWIVSDRGHAAGKRLLDYREFARPDGHKSALLVECGQHWQAGSGAVAIETSLRFLIATGAIPADFAAPYQLPVPPTPQQLIEITDAVTAGTDRFVYTADYIGMEVIDTAGTVIGFDGDRPVRTPYDRCVLIMPSRRLRRGQTAVRLGRILD
jgi:predicted deacylase